jgi:hypothetical protein
VRRLKRVINTSCSQEFLQGVAFAVSPLTPRRQGNMDALGLPQHRSSSRSKPTSELVSDACCTSTVIRSELS